MCKNRRTCTPGVSIVKTGKCPGGVDNICCIPKCIGSGGSCKNRNSCNLNNFKIETGKGPGGRNNICCIPTKSTAGNDNLFNAIRLVFSFMWTLFVSKTCF